MRIDPLSTFSLNLGEPRVFASSMAEALPRPDLSVVVPVMNEADNIAPLIGEIAAALSGRVNFEIVYVDDGSTDGSFERLRSLQAEFPMLRAQRHRSRRGQHALLSVQHWMATARTIPPISRPCSMPTERIAINSRSCSLAIARRAATAG